MEISQGLTLSAAQPAWRATCQSPLPAALLSVERWLLILSPASRLPVSVVAVFSLQICQKILQVDEITWVFDHTLAEQFVGVVVILLFGAALRMLKNLVQALPNGGRQRDWAAKPMGGWLRSHSQHSRVLTLVNLARVKSARVKSALLKLALLKLALLKLHFSPHADTFEADTVEADTVEADTVEADTAEFARSPSPARFPTVDEATTQNARRDVF